MLCQYSSQPTHHTLDFVAENLFIILLSGFTAHYIYLVMCVWSISVYYVTIISASVFNWTQLYLPKWYMFSTPDFFKINCVMSLFYKMDNTVPIHYLWVNLVCSFLNGFHGNILLGDALLQRHWELNTWREIMKRKLVGMNGKIFIVKHWWLFWHFVSERLFFFCLSRWFGGLFLDIKRKAPHYLSDYYDAFSLQCVASFLFLYCACMSPVITFGGLLGEATEGRIVNHFPFPLRASGVLPGPAGCTAQAFQYIKAEFNMVHIFQSHQPSITSLLVPALQSAIESLFGASLTGIAYSLFAGQPLTILGSTGPVLVFEKILFKFCKYVVFTMWQIEPQMTSDFNLHVAWFGDYIIWYLSAGCW